MASWDRTWRDVDGVRVEGCWRHAFIRNGGRYFFTDLKIYADGMVDCWGLVPFEEFAHKVRSGWVATEFEDGADASAHGVAGWTMTSPRGWVEADDLIAEVADDIERLNDRPTSEDRCLAAAETFVDEPTERNRTALRAAYDAVPEHLRIFLGDMDNRDIPLLTLMTPEGESLYGGDADPVTAEDRAWAREYVQENRRARSPEVRRRWDDPERPPGERRTVMFGNADELQWLSPASPHPVDIEGLTYPTAMHAYWARSTIDADLATRIREAGRVHDAQRLAEDAPRREDWSAVRPAVMADLLRAKFAQHPELADRLLETGDAVLICFTGVGTRYWERYGEHGHNWIGRLLEVVRAEIALTRTQARG
ncbi:NADAR family protein [Actinomadura sp. HBU206391]|uniref:NADAR family protein n=1 Tax=Actinomadura sp. HBU206391 TaxID=2731692 RepID=UPI0016503789|nr:NADAR family protein [Actinomadura sp. HBU206391]MBC6456691.1 NADAR family protein [Actinomadura sp. HBU206391]